MDVSYTMRLRAVSVVVPALVVGATALAAVAGAAGGGDRVLRFATVERDSTPERAPVGTSFAFASVADRVSHDPLDRPGRVNPVDYRKFVAVYVAVVRATSGYSVAIRRVTLQRRGVFEQVCARVAVTPPPADRVVTQVKTRFWHFVKIPRRSFGVSVPLTIVARDTNGRLLYTLAAARPRLCR